MSLKVFDLQCAHGHVFEGWFNGTQGFEDQSERGLLSCPMCGDTHIERKLSAPRLNLGKSGGAHDTMASSQTGATQHTAVMAPSSPQIARFQAELLRHMRDVVSGSENVGDRFAQEALKMHRGDSRERAIRGTASYEERRELAEEGISVMPVPDFLDDDQLQ